MEVELGPELVNQKDLRMVYLREVLMVGRKHVKEPLMVVAMGCRMVPLWE